MLYGHLSASGRTAARAERDERGRKDGASGVDGTARPDGGAQRRVRRGERLACVDLPAFALQLLLRREPEFGTGPAAVVDRDHPQGRVLSANLEARRQRVLPGQRYATALGICPGLRAAEVPPEEIAAGTDEVLRLLDRFSPEAEPAAHEPGVFWVNAAGLVLLHPSLLEWAERLHGALVAEGLRGAVVCGFGRFATYALARVAGEGPRLVADPEEERRLAARVPLERLALEPALRDALLRLGVRTVGDFLRLPPEGLATRFGKEAARLHRIASGEMTEPLAPRRPAEPPVRRIAFEMPETDSARLLACLERALPGLLAELAERRHALAALHVRLVREKGPPTLCEVRPASPTLALPHLLELVRLQLQAELQGTAPRDDDAPPARRPARRRPRPGADADAVDADVPETDAPGRSVWGVEEAVLTARGVPAQVEQLRLFRENPRRDLRAGARALARLRAEHGPGSVVVARLLDAHLPEASFVLEPLTELRLPDPARTVIGGPRAPGEVDDDDGHPPLPRLVRRIELDPVPLPHRPRYEPDGWLVAGLACGPVRRSHGPYVLSGGWWGAAPGAHGGVHREYHYVETARGDLLWVFYDGRRRRWFLHGSVD